MRGLPAHRRRGGSICGSASSCGRVGCCDDSPNRHATAHARRDGHPIIRSLEPGETWCWCYVDELALDIPDVRGTTRIPPSPLLLAGRPQEER